MKTFGIIHIVLFLLLMIAYQCASAQDYVVTTKGDSISGKVKPMSYGPKKKVQLTTADKKKIFYSLFQIRRFSHDGEIFKPVKGNAGYSFMKVLKDGYLSLLAFQMENQATYDGRYLLKKDGKGIEVPNLSFKKSMKNFLGECPKVTDKIESGVYTKKDLEKIIDEYNAFINTTAETIQKQQTVVAEQTQKLNPWEALQKKVNDMTALTNKQDALEMISEIKSKISRGEKVPNFMVEGLKGILNQPEIQPELTAALKEIQ